MSAASEKLHLVDLTQERALQSLNFMLSSLVSSEAAKLPNPVGRKTIGAQTAKAISGGEGAERRIKWQKDKQILYDSRQVGI